MKLNYIPTFILLISSCITHELTYDDIPCKVDRPNILLFVADDWGWPFAGAYGYDQAITPTFDYLAENGILFENAFVSSPSCTPSRGAILTGQDFWRLGEGANLRSTLSASLSVFPLILEESGYTIGYKKKGWGPGDLSAGGYKDRTPLGIEYKGTNALRKFLKEKPLSSPFFFWFGSDNPHRPFSDTYRTNSQIIPPVFLPNNDTIKSDIENYLVKINQFDAELAKAIETIKEYGYWKNTVIIVTSDNGMPFPRSKANLYDYGVRVPLAIYWCGNERPGRNIEDLVSLIDIAPTIMNIAGIQKPSSMTGRTLMPILKDSAHQKFDEVIYGRERHVLAQQKPLTQGYPSRAIRTDSYLYIYNFEPTRWPSGIAQNSTDGRPFADCDPGLSKTFLINNKNTAQFTEFFDLAFDKRPAEELYDLKKDPYQVVNLAQDNSYKGILKSLNERLFNVLYERNDPRILGYGDVFDEYPYRK